VTFTGLNSGYVYKINVTTEAVSADGTQRATAADSISRRTLFGTTKPPVTTNPAPTPIETTPTPTPTPEPTTPAPTPTPTPTTPAPSPEPTTPVPSPSPSPIDIPVSVTVLGDSNSNGYDTNLATGVADGKAYITLQRGLLHFDGGWAQSGDTSAKLLTKMPTNLHSDVAAIMIGTNDIAYGVKMSVTEANIKAIAANSGASKITLLAIAPYNSKPTQATAMNLELKRIASENGWGYTDPWATLRTSAGKWTTGATLEGIHGTEASYKVAGYAIEKYLVQKYANVTVN
jgi:hypothetical protein